MKAFKETLISEKCLVPAHRLSPAPAQSPSPRLLPVSSGDLLSFCPWRNAGLGRWGETGHHRILSLRLNLVQAQEEK